MKIKECLPSSEFAALQNFLGYLAANEIPHVRVGSSTIKGAWTRGVSDVDWVVYQEERRGEGFEGLLQRRSFEEGGSDVQEAEFTSYKRGPLNFILCFDKDFYKKYVDAASICTGAQVVNKEHRIAVHDFVLQRDYRPNPEVFAEIAAKGYTKTPMHQAYEDSTETESSLW